MTPQTSKSLSYVDAKIVGPYFSMFVGIWIYFRHYLNLHILWATLTEFRSVGPFELNWETQQYKCSLSQVITFTLLASLQAINLFWLYLILRIATNYVFTSVPVDDRSDVEDEEEVDHRDTAKVSNGKALQNIEGVNGNAAAGYRAHTISKEIEMEKKEL